MKSLHNTSQKGDMDFNKYKLLSLLEINHSNEHIKQQRPATYREVWWREDGRRRNLLPSVQAIAVTVVDRALGLRR